MALERQKKRKTQYENKMKGRDTEWGMHYSTIITNERIQRQKNQEEQ